MAYNIIGDSPCLDTNTTCDFSIANGACLTVIGVVGFLMSTFTLYCLIFHVKLPSRQNIFIMNVSVGDITIALLGTVRGLGILSPYYVGVDDNEQPNWWCYMYTLIGNSLWMTVIPVLIPLTVDRFVAINFPFKYLHVMTLRTCKIMILLTWLPILVLLIFDCISYGVGTNQITYQKSYHRCVYENSRTWRKAVFTIIPFISIILMYISMLFFVNKMKIETKRLMIMSTAIIGTGLLTNTPDQLLTNFKIPMTYEVAAITTITFFYMNSILNPIIYFCSSRYTRKDLAGTAIGRRISRHMMSDHKSDSGIMETLRTGTAVGLGRRVSEYQQRASLAAQATTVYANRSNDDDRQESTINE